MKRNITIIFFLLVVSFSGCGDDDNPVISFDRLTPEEITIQNCHITQAAVEAFAKENNGDYALRLTDTTPVGHTIVDFLPGGEYLENPYTGLRTEPQNMSKDPGIGEILYAPTICGSVARGYLILTYDKEVDPCPWYCLNPFNDGYYYEELGTVCKGGMFQYYVEDFAANNNGVYPVDIHNDEDLRGRTALFIFSGGFENIFTELITNPVAGTASAPDEIGYEPVVENEVAVGYIITMFGANEIIREYSYIPAVE
jgi:hypothetical protein